MPPAGARPRPRVGYPRRRGRGWGVLLVVPMVLPLLTPVYNRMEPEIWGVPFFYWYQMGCAIVAMFTIGLVHHLTKRRR